MKNKRTLILGTFGVILSVCAGTHIAFAVTDFEDVPAGDKVAIHEEVAPIVLKNTSNEECGFEAPEEKVYGAKVITTRNKLRVEENENFRVKVFVKNTGNMPWFSDQSTCLGPKAFLGTDKERDHESVFYSEVTEEDNNWASKNRVRMDQLRTDPGQIASFTFWGNAGDDNDVYKQFMTPMIDNITWIEDATFSFEVMVGEQEDPISELRKKMMYANESGSVADINLDGERKMVIDLSDQYAKLLLDDMVIREFLISSGAPATPTPVGEHKISLKQETRIGGAAPHYIMPNFMMFKAGGYGLHSLPSLGRKNAGVFWTEALDHIGRPVSHGCVRMLPEDSDFAFEFLQVGDAVVVEK